MVTETVSWFQIYENLFVVNIVSTPFLKWEFEFSKIDRNGEVAA